MVMARFTERLTFHRNVTYGLPYRLPYRLPYMVYLLFAEIFSPESRLAEVGGAPTLVDIKSTKTLFQLLLEKM